MMIKNSDGTTTFIADEEGMQNFLEMIFQDEFNVKYRHGKAEFKTEIAAKKAYEYLIEDNYLPSRGYGFTLNGKIVECKITKLTVDTFVDLLDIDPNYVKYSEERYK